jgi:hypothetical protein
MPLPNGYLTIQQAVEANGLSEKQIRNNARKIRRDENYTIMGVKLDKLQRLINHSCGVMGLPPGGLAALPILPGCELRKLHEGHIILRAEMVGYWKAAEDKHKELKAAGYKTVDEAAEELGITVNELKDMLKRMK